MMIHILKSDGCFDYVKPDDLCRKLAKNEVVSFERDDGICMVGKDPVRTEQAVGYSGSDRRRQL